MLSQHYYYYIYESYRAKHHDLVSLLHDNKSQLFASSTITSENILESGEMV